MREREAALRAATQDLENPMKAIYLAGPINACDDSEAMDWREEAKALLPFAKIIDPMSRDFRGIEGDHTDEIVVGDKADIRCADACVFNAWQPSAGTSMELLYAYECKKPTVVVVPSIERVSPWIRFHADRLTESVEEACAWAMAVTQDDIRRCGRYRP